MLAKNPGHIFLLIGINDIASHRNVDRFSVEYAGLIRSIKRLYPQAFIASLSLLPTRGKYAYLNGLVPLCNSFISAFSTENGCCYIDLHSKLVDSHGRLGSLYSLDGLHLSPVAYWLWRAEVERVMGWPKLTAPRRWKVGTREFGVFVMKKTRVTLQTFFDLKPEPVIALNR